MLKPIYLSTYAALCRSQMVTLARSYGQLSWSPSTSCRRLWHLPRFFGPPGKKRAHYAVFAHFWFSIVTSFTLSCNLNNNNKNKNKIVFLTKEKLLLLS